MEEKEIIYGDGIALKIRSGIKSIYVPVAMTLGSHGKYVALEGKNGKYRFTKDGVGIAREIMVEDKFEQIFVQALYDASMSTLNMLGDGTTSTIILAYNMITNMMDSIQKSEKMDIKRFMDGIEWAMSIIEKEHKLLKSSSEATLKDLISVATTSSNGDSNFGALVGEIYHKIGSEGIIDISYHDDQEITVDYADGYIVDEGILAYEFMNTNGMCVLDNPYVYITNRPLTDPDEFMNIILEKVHASNDSSGKKRPLVVIAGDFSRDVLSTMLKNMEDIVCCPVKAPSTGDLKNNYLEDIAKVTGATFINGEKDMHLSDYPTMDVVGTAKNIKVKINETVISIDGEVDPEYISSLEDILKDSGSDVLKEFLSKRLAKLKGSIATLNLKKSTTTEMSLDYDRYDDSIKATRNAIKNGVLTGGGVVYAHLARVIVRESEIIDDNDFQLGADSIRESMMSIIRVNLDNSGHSDEEISKITHDIMVSNDISMMYDTRTREYKSGREVGIMESYLSSIVCIRNAFSVAKTIINTGSAVVKAPKLHMM